MQVYDKLLFSSYNAFRMRAAYKEANADTSNI